MRNGYVNVLMAGINSMAEQSEIWRFCSDRNVYFVYFVMARRSNKCFIYQL